MHLQFAKVGSFYRYEAYLIALATLGVGVCIATLIRDPRIDERRRWLGSPARRMATGALILLVLMPLGRRALAAMVNAHRASRNVYQQQVQMGHFLQRFYEGQSVAINDIGAVGYLADLPILDLWGLADREVSDLLRSGHFATEDIRRLAVADRVTIAMVYESSFASAGGLPSQWSKIGEWEIRDNFICGGATVSFWSVDPANAPMLKQQLDSFATELPSDVMVRVW